MRNFKLITLAIIIASMSMLISCKNDKKDADKSSNILNPEEVKQKVETKIPSFNYKPSKPTNGKLKGVVELGASGFNLFIIDIDENKNWSSKKKEFGSSLISESMTSSKEVKATLKEYISKIFSYGVKSDNIHFVVSSGAAKEKVTTTIIEALKDLGYHVNVVTPEQEAQYAFKAVLPEEFKEKAFVIDMGSGNTKISFLENDKIIGKETYGSKYFQKNIDAKIVYDDVKAKVTKVPENKRKTCFIIGGVPYSMAKTSRKEKERYTTLYTDLSKYDQLALDKGKKITSGLNIYKSILDVTNCKEVVFDWDANFTIGFLISLPH